MHEVTQSFPKMVRMIILSEHSILKFSFYENAIERWNKLSFENFILYHTIFILNSNNPYPNAHLHTIHLKWS